ncbi:MAG: O-antigen ligase family protein [bacterium]|uniref:O-antigen ligase family protein n=1 Tax=Candidatus Aphodosoma intestinipullorum TaxID=2840674 RepID=A0A940DKP0_9BACT|nr:O-antigen ligase family protein [Candidatus Aphodosoma intestinipullorum]
MSATPTPNRHTISINTISNLNANLNALAAIYIMVAWIRLNHTVIIGYWIFFVTAAADIILNRKYRDLKWSNDKLIYITMIAFFAIIPLWQLAINPDFTDRFFIKEAENHLPFLGIGVIGLFGLNSRIKLIHVGFAMVAAANLVELYILYKAGFDNIIYSENRFQLIEAARNKYVNSHMVVNMYFNTAFLFAIYLLSRSRISYKVKILLLIFTVPIIGQLLISDGRTGFATTILLIGCVIVYMLWRLNHRIVWISLPIITAISILILLQHPRIENVSDDPRFYIWDLGIQMFCDRPMGYGAIDGHRTYVESFFAQCPHDWFYVQYPTKTDIYLMHPHNVFLESSINYGVIGLVVSLAVYLLPLFISEVRRKPFIYCFFLIMFGQCCFDVYNSFPSIAYALGIIIWLQGKWTK